MRDGPRSRRRGETNRAGQTSPRPPREPSSRAVIKMVVVQAKGIPACGACAVLQPKRGARPTHKNNCGMAGRGRGTALGPDDRDNIRVQLDVLRATARNSKFRRHTRLRLLASTQAGPARGATGHPRHARRGERRGPGPHREGRPGAAGDGPAPRGHRGRAAGGERGLRSCGACNGAPHFARNGACDGACDGARNGACDGAGRRSRGTSGGDPDGPAGPRPRPAPRPLAVTRARLDTG